MAKINPHIFRGYDLRGIVEKDLNTDIVEILGKSYGTFLAKKDIKQVVVGYDCRLTSPEYSTAIIKGLLAVGVDVIDIGLALVGNLYWAQHYFNYLGGVMVTASHNPPEYNGFKFATGLSSTMLEDEIQELRQIAEKEDFVKPEKQGTLKKQDITQEYFKDLAGRFNIEKKFKVVVDASCSTPGAFVPEALRRVGCEVIESNCEIDGNFPVGTPDPTEIIVAERLAKKVLEEQADIGFSYDADGDRIGIVDSKGTILWNDILVALLAIDVIEQNPGAKIVFNTLCSKVVEETIISKKGQPIMWRTGHSFIKAKAKEEKAKFAGELSGHFFFFDKFYGHDDGIYTSLRLLEYLSRTNQSLFEAVDVLPKYISSPEIKVGCSDDLKVELMKKIAEKARGDFKNAEIIDDERAADGVRVEMDTSMFVIRYSQNGPYITIKFEAKEQDRYNELRDYIKNLLHSYKEVDWSFGVNVDTLDK